MSTKPRKRSASRRHLGSKSASPKIPDSLVKEALPLVKGLADHTTAAFAKARTLLNQFMSPSASHEPTPSDQLLFLLACALSSKVLPGYATLDPEHITEIQSILASIKKYAEDSSQRRPLNFLMLASPGAGKSHLIHCLASCLGTHRFGPVTCNMAGLQRYEDLIPPLESARNIKVEDKVPLIFFDEFDSKQSNYALLLPLLWDGQLTLGQHELKLGKVVIVLAGSEATLPSAMENARSMRPQPPLPHQDAPKLSDLLSRINGKVLKVPQLSDPYRSSKGSADKVCIAVSLLRKRFGRSLLRAPVALLRFIAGTEFRYGVRSMAHLVELIPHKKDAAELTLKQLALPLNDIRTLEQSSLAYHVFSETQAEGIIKTWEEAIRCEAAVSLSSDILDFNIDHFRRTEREWTKLLLHWLWEEVNDKKPAMYR